MTKISTLLYEEEYQELVDQFIRNIDLFAWALFDMPSIDTKVMCHFLSVNPSVRPVSQRNWKVGKEKRVSIDEVVNKLANASFISEIK